MFDYLIVGAGFAGCVLAERLVAVKEKKVLITDKWNHIAGNAYDFYDEAGILIHKYGPHILVAQALSVSKKIKQGNDDNLNRGSVVNFSQGNK